MCPMLYGLKVHDLSAACFKRHVKKLSSSLKNLEVIPKNLGTPPRTQTSFSALRGACKNLWDSSV